MGTFTSSVETWIRLNFSGASEKNTILGTDCVLVYDGLSETTKDFCFYSFVKTLFDRLLLGLSGT